MMRDTFPYLSHRTLAEVAETERLRDARAECRMENRRVPGHVAYRLQALEARAAWPRGGA